jgi:uncharacterized GH25 family protein
MKLLATFVLCLGAHASVLAHDMWIEPTNFAPELGRVLGLKLRVGDDFRGEPIPRNDELIERFVVVDANGQRGVVGRAGADPAGLLRVTATGPMVVGYQSRPNPVSLTGAKFTSYLKEQGLDRILALREQKSQALNGVREQFIRCAKSLVRTGPAGSQPADRALGLTLELVAEADPTSLAPGQDLPVRLTYLGRALAGVRVVAVNPRNPWDRLPATSDLDGRVRFRLTEGGTWMVRAVHMIPSPARAQADWVSYWASITFDAAPGS